LLVLCLTATDLAAGDRVNLRRGVCKGERIPFPRAHPRLTEPTVNDLRITHIGGPTALIEIGGWRLLTDPTFDPPGRRYNFGWGTSSRKLAGPAIPAAELGTIDAVLLSHDHHGDNLDPAGRALLPSLGVVVTTASGAKRLGADARGLLPWQTTKLEADRRPTIEITATPCRHGPPLTRPIVGDVIGFALRWEGQEHGVLWISGDTVLYDGVREVGHRLQVDTALLHLGGVRFPVTGPLRYTMTAHEAVELCKLVRPRVVIPIHYEGWKHFREGREAIERELAEAPEEIRGSVRWLPIGVATDLSV
jgi:L-ascorbate metabolism protein UlaG (beta-lactamase superfamily)